MFNVRGLGCSWGHFDFNKWKFKMNSDHFRGDFWFHDNRIHANPIFFIQNSRGYCMCDTEESLWFYLISMCTGDLSGHQVAMR